MDIEKLQQICMNMPAAKAAIKWEVDLVFTVGGKMFCIASTNIPFVVSLKVPDEDFDSWCTKPNVIPAPYMARAKWVQFTMPQQLTSSEVEDLVRGSYQLVQAKLTKKQKVELGLEI